MKGHLRYLGAFFALCVIPALVLASRMPLKSIMLAFLLFLFSIIFLTLTDIALTKRKESAAWGYQFNPKAILDVYIFGLPIEEYVFNFTLIFLPVGIWELLKQLNLSFAGMALITACGVLVLLTTFPILRKPDA